MATKVSSFPDEASLEALGIRLLADERVHAAVELDDGLTEDLEQRRATLFLTDRRLVRYSEATHRANAVSVALSDLHTIEVSRTEKARQRAWVSVMFIVGGLLLGIISLLFLRSPISPMLMALSLVLIGVVFMLSYTGGLAGVVIVKAGAKSIKCRVRSGSLDDMAELVQRLTDLKIGSAQEGGRAENASGRLGYDQGRPAQVAPTGTEWESGT